GDSEHIEIEDVFPRPVILYDVRTRLLGWVLRRWWQRCLQHRANLPNRDQRIAGLRADRPWLVFLPNFENALEDRVAWCRRHGGVPLTGAERWVVRRSFLFRKIST